MKIFLRPFPLLPLAVCFLLAMVLPAVADQPHMKAALDILHQAHDGGDKIALLRAARKELEEAVNNAGNLRRDAIKLVSHAIAEGEAGHKEKMEEDISAAITLVRDGISAER